MKLKAARRSGTVALHVSRKEAAFPPIALPDFHLKRILAPIDFSESSRKAAIYAAAFARQFSAEVLLLHVLETLPPPPPMMVLESEALDPRFIKETEKHVGRWRDEMLSGVIARTIVRSATVAYKEILEVAREQNVDLIIAGTLGRTGLAHLFIGSTAERLVRHAPCPVLIVREREKDFVLKSRAQAGVKLPQPHTPAEHST